MSELQGAILSRRGVVEVSGPAAREFLNGIVTIDVGDVRPGAARNGALLTPQGKILFEFVLMAEGDDGFLLDVDETLRGDLARRLIFYRLRTKVEIAEREDLVVAALWGREAIAVDGAVPDPRLPDLGWRAILPAAEAEARLASAGAEVVDEGAYHARRIALGVPELGPDYAAGEVFPHEADLDQLAGVDFDKGCFVGQEVVSRMQHRGTARKRFVPVSIEGRLPPPGAGINAGDSVLGVVGSAADGHALALIRLDRLGDALAEKKGIEADGSALTPLRPAWARFEWPGG